MHVELRGVTRRFAAVTALDGVDLELPSGSRTALIGPNGSGKSTLTRALLGLIRYQGTIALDGRARRPDDPAAARATAYVPQVAPRLAATVGELIAAVCSVRGTAPGRVAEVAGRLGLDVASVARRPLRVLSGGMRQKTLAAMALAADARLLVLDEPTASMDPRSRRAFFEVVDELPRTTTVVLCSHRFDEMRSLVDRVAMLADGRLRFVGPADEFLRRRSTSLVEVRARAESDADLRALGFRHGATGWWSRTAPTAERAALVRTLVEVLGDALLDLLATDLEDLRNGSPSAPEPSPVSVT